MITLFTTCKDFTDLAKIHQYNALRSWRKVFPNAEIIIFGREKGIQPIAQEIGALQEIKLDYGAGGTPYVDQIFSIAQEKASRSWLCYINADIIVTSTFKGAIMRVRSCRRNRKWGNCLMIGQRWDVILDEEIQFDDPDWEDKLIVFTVKAGRRHFRKGKGLGIDYFYFRKNKLWDEMPPFLIHRLWWDTWLPWHVANTKKLPVIDATDCAFVVHPLHSKPEPPKVEVARNRRLAQERWMYCYDAPWVASHERCFRR